MSHSHNFVYKDDDMNNLIDSFIDISTPQEGALAALILGIPVFPVNPLNKQPLIKNWRERATLSTIQVQNWWDQSPNAMIGACMGKASGYFGIDIDVKDGVDAETKLGQLEKKFGRVDYLMKVRTPSGGLHLYVPMPKDKDVRNSASKIAAGVDIRGSGGYLVFAGSIRSDGIPYTVIEMRGGK